MGIYIFVLYYKIGLWTVMLLFEDLIYTHAIYLPILCVCVGRTQRVWGFTVCPLLPLHRVHSCIPPCVFRSSIIVSPLSTSCASHPLNEAVIAVKAPQFVFTCPELKSHSLCLLICAFSRSPDSYQSAMILVFNIRNEKSVCKETSLKPPTCV